MLIDILEDLVALAGFGIVVFLIWYCVTPHSDSDTKASKFSKESVGKHDFMNRIYWFNHD